VCFARTRSISVICKGRLPSSDETTFLIRRGFGRLVNITLRETFGKCIGHRGRASLPAACAKPDTTFEPRRPTRATELRKVLTLSSLACVEILFVAISVDLTALAYSFQARRPPTRMPLPLLLLQQRQCRDNGFVQPQNRFARKSSKGPKPANSMT